MRSGLDAATLALYLSGEFEVHSRLNVANGSGTLVNLQGRYSNYSLKLPNPTEPIGSLGVQFIRETTAAGTSTSLAPTVVGSTYNKLDDGTTFSPLLQLGRTVTLDVALTAVGGARPADGSSLWYEVFRGIITQVDWPEWDSRNASINCNGLAAILQHAKSEAAYTYAAGTSIETVAREILDNNGFAAVPIHFPVATGKVLPNTYGPGLQKTVWSQLWELAQSMGWVCYYRYRGSNPAEITFFEPARGKTVADMTVPAWDYRSLSFDETELRNVGYLVYYQTSGQQEMIGPFEDAASILKYGGFRRPFWIKLEEDSPIRANADATDMLNAALSDVSDPDALAAIITFPLVFAESGVDLYTFPAKQRLFDSDQTFAPYGAVINIAGNAQQHSIVEVRGVPTAGSRTWRDITGEPEGASFLIQYASDDQGTNSSTTFDPATHTYASHSTDNGLTWTPWYRIVGESGASAEGRYTVYIFRVATTQPATPTGGTGATPPSGWFDAPPAYDPNTGNRLWMSKAEADGLDDSLLTTWSTPVRLTGEAGPTGPAGPQGEQGIQGPAGTDTYFHVAYAESADGTVGFNHTGGTYIGTYVDSIEADSNNPADYTWQRFQGAEGPQGDQGIPGEPGDDGLTPYLHIAYADDAAGTGFSQDPTGKTYIGTYSDFVQADSSNPADYTWAKIQGPQGPAGTSVEVQYASDTSGSNLSTTFVPGTHFYMRVRLEGGTWGAWARIVGETGAEGDAGATGDYYDYIFRVATSAPPTPTGTTPTGWSDDPPPVDTELGEKLWMSKALRDGDTDAIIVTWSAPVSLSGPPGQINRTDLDIAIGLTEQPGTVLRVSVASIDPSAAGWALYLKKGSSPVTAEGDPDPLYSVDNFIPREQVYIDLPVDTGTWHVVAAAVDALNSIGTLAVASITISGTAATGYLEHPRISVSSAGGYHEVRWDHDAGVESGGFTVRIFEKRGKKAPVQLVTGRNATWEYNNTNATPNYGSYRSTGIAFGVKNVDEYVTWTYTIELRNASNVLVQTLTASTTGWYEPEAIV